MLDRRGAVASRRPDPRPRIDPAAALALKRRIDRSNQERTDTVEEMDTLFREKYRDVVPQPDATINTESPA